MFKDRKGPAKANTRASIIQPMVHGFIIRLLPNNASMFGDD
jgi:hypothetical protein